MSPRQAAVSVTLRPAKRRFSLPGGMTPSPTAVTEAPAAAKALAIAKPIPEVPPETRAVRPVNENMQYQSRTGTMDERISQIRKSYLSGELDDANLGNDPISMFADWMNAAIEMGIEEPNGMALATASADGAPSVRIVLLRGFDRRGFVFYTNYESAKGQDLLANPRAAISFWWQPLERQVRIAGSVEKVARAEAESYFATRPRGHRLSAWASPQSRAVKGRAELQARAEEMEALFPGDVPLPEFWGGYRLAPDRIEFWQGRENRLHDRLLFEKRQEEWTVARLAP